MDGDPVIQGSSLAAPAGQNITQTPTNLANSGTTGSGTCLYLFGSSQTAYGDGLYAVGYNGYGVRSYSYRSDGVYGLAIGQLATMGVRGLAVSPDSSSAGVLGENQNAVGVRGEGGNAGVVGQASGAGAAGVHGVHRSGLEDGIGVFGFARTGVWGEGSTGVVGQSARDFGVGVEGNASGTSGVGVFGAASGTRGGIGVYATAPTPDSAALQVNGRAVFSSSGRIIVPAGAVSASETGLSFASATLILAMLQEDRPGVAVRAAVPDPATGTVTVYLTQAPTADTAVAWFALN